MEQISEGALGDELEGNSWEEGLPPCAQSKLQRLHGCSVHNFLWQIVPVRDFSNAECMLTTTGPTLLLVNLESMTSKPNAVGSAKTASHGKSRWPCIMLRESHAALLSVAKGGISETAAFLWGWSQGF